MVVLVGCRVGLFDCLGRFLQALRDLVQQIPDAGAVLARDLEQRIEAQLVELERRFAGFTHIYLVDQGEDRRIRRAQLLHDLEVARNEALLAVEHQQQQVSLCDRLLPFFRNHLMQWIFGRAEHATGVEHHEIGATPRHRLLNQIARRPRDRRHDRAARFRDPIEQRGLADVGSANQHDEGSGASHDGIVGGDRGAPARNCARSGLVVRQPHRHQRRI